MKFTGTENQLYSSLHELYKTANDGDSFLDVVLQGTIKDIFKICDELEGIGIQYSLNLRKIKSTLGEIKDVGYQPPFSFRNLSFLKSLYLPDTVKRLYRNGIENCPALEKVRLPEGISEISNKAFLNCPNLTVFIPSALQNGSPKMFWNVKKVVFSKHGPFRMEGKSIISKDGKIFYGTLDVESEDLQIPQGIEMLSPYSFWEQEGVVRFPESLKEISANSFQNCSCTLVFETPMKVKFPRTGFPKGLIVPQYEETLMKQDKIKKFKDRATQAALEQRLRELETLLPKSDRFTIKLSNPLYSKDCILCEVEFPKDYGNFICSNRMNFFIPILEGFETEAEHLVRILKGI